MSPPQGSCCQHLLCTLRAVGYLFALCFKTDLHACCITFFPSALRDGCAVDVHMRHGYCPTAAKPSPCGGIVEGGWLNRGGLWPTRALLRQIAWPWLCLWLTRGCFAGHVRTFSLPVLLSALSLPGLERSSMLFSGQHNQAFQSSSLFVRR